LPKRMAWIARGLVATLCLVAFGGCKQGLGERCEINSDCEDGLVCSQSKKECTSTGSAADAGFVDAFFADARPADANVPTPDAPPGSPDADTTDADTTTDAAASDGP
jgi:hypothetical protein